MIAVLCAVAFLPSALSTRSISLPSRDDYLRTNLKDVLTYIPPNDVELWFGWRRIYMGEELFSKMPTEDFSVRFGAPSGRLSTVVLVRRVDEFACGFLWLRVNVPGGKELRTTWPVHRYGKLIVLIFPQKVILDENAANRTSKTLRGCDTDGLQAALQLDRVDAVTIYTTSLTSCGNEAYFASNESTPNWDLLRPNLDRLSHYKLFVTRPRGVVEVEYFEGVSLRMGNCLPVFLTASPPRSLKFAATTGTYYTLYFLDPSEKTPSWLLVNVPEGDFSLGVEVVPYSPYTDDFQKFTAFVYLLYSQGNNELPFSEVRKVSPLTPEDISGRFSLGDPVATNFYVAYKFKGPVPNTHPSAGPPTRSPFRDPSLTTEVPSIPQVAPTPEVPSTSRVAPAPGVPSTPRAPSTPRVLSTGALATTTQKALVTRTSTASTLTLQNGSVCLAVTGLLVVFQAATSALEI